VKPPGRSLLSSSGVFAAVALLVSWPTARGSQEANKTVQLWVDGPPSEVVRVGRAADGRMCLPIAVNGKEYNFYVDTGASTTVHGEIAKKLKIKSSDSGANSVDPLGNAQKILTGNVTLKVGHYSITNAQVVVTDLSALRQMNVQQKLPALDGILGSEVLLLLRAKLNFANNTIEFLRPEANALRVNP